MRTPKRAPASRRLPSRTELAAALAALGLLAPGTARAQPADAGSDGGAPPPDRGNAWLVVDPSSCPGGKLSVDGGQGVPIGQTGPPMFVPVAAGSHVVEWRCAAAEMDPSHVTLAAQAELHVSPEPSDAMMVTGGVPIQDHFGGSGCCGSLRAPETAGSVPSSTAAGASLLALLAFARRRRGRPG